MRCRRDGDARLDADIEITDEEVAEALREPRDFAYFGEAGDDMFVTWSLGPVIRHRESGLVQQSNADALLRHLGTDSTLKDVWRVTSCGHWAVGWVDHLSFRAVDDDGRPARIFRVMKQWQRVLREEYPIADEEDLARREHEATVAWVEAEGRSLVEGGAHDGWACDVVRWLDENEPRAVEATDGWGGCPTAAQVRAALAALGLLRADEATAEPGGAP